MSRHLLVYKSEEESDNSDENNDVLVAKSSEKSKFSKSQVKSQITQSGHLKSQADKTDRKSHVSRHLLVYKSEEESENSDILYI